MWSSLFAFWLIYSMLFLGTLSPEAAEGTLEIALWTGLFGLAITSIALYYYFHYKKVATGFTLHNCDCVRAGDVLRQVRRDPQGIFLIFTNVDGEHVRRKLTAKQATDFQSQSSYLPASRPGECWRIYSIDPKNKTIACHGLCY